MKVTLLIPTVNEVGGMRKIMPRIKKEWVDEIIVVDGGSIDGSYEFAKEQGCLVLRQKSKGLANSYWEALEVAQGDVIITFSPDGNSVPERIPELIDKMKQGYDLVVVSRYYNGAKSYDDNPITAFGNWMFTAMINFLFGSHYTDVLVIFRAWRRELVQTIDRNVPQTGFEPMLSIQCRKYKKKVAEIAGDEPKRIDGKGKVNRFRAGWGILNVIFKELLTR